MGLAWLWSGLAHRDEQQRAEQGLAFLMRRVVAQLLQGVPTALQCKHLSWNLSVHCGGSQAMSRPTYRFHSDLSAKKRQAKGPEN